MAHRKTTIAEAFETLAPGTWRDAVNWPPDVFALCAYILQRSGAYIEVVRQWPPGDGANSASEWSREIKRIGNAWSDSNPKNPTIPQEVIQWWEQIGNSSGLTLTELAGNDSAVQRHEIWQTLVQMVACADEACSGLGFPGKNRRPIDRHLEDLFLLQTLEHGCIRTLCERLSPEKLCILPKLHTPQCGITLRSLSHNLAFCETREVSPSWWRHGFELPNLQQGLNLLLLPWPKSIAPTQFNPVTHENCDLRNMPGKFGFFKYQVREPSTSWPTTRFEEVLKAATTLSGRIDGVVLPELAVQSDDVDRIWGQLREHSPGSFLIAGVGGDSSNGGVGVNRVAMLLPAPFGPFRIYQDKHHRWLLSGSQVRNYGLAGRLDPNRDWWEHSTMSQRSLKFHALDPSLTICCLVCEDLARQDPISDFIRAIGPNLVIALLMDGPQLKSRWPARYATVLADDPGSSVLTLTSLGMTRLSKPFGTPESRVVALWKDSANGPFEIELPYDAEALVLSIAPRAVEEWTADGRSDDKSSAVWELKAVFPVRLTDK